MIYINLEYGKITILLTNKYQHEYLADHSNSKQQ